MSDRISTWSDEFKNAQRLQTRLDETQDVAYSTRQGVRDLQEQIAGLRRDVTALQAQMATTDAKTRLNEFDPARRIRAAADAAIDCILAEHPLPADVDFAALDDERGYWLAPLTRALPGWWAGHPDEALLTAAAARDERRTATFRAALALFQGRPDQSLQWLTIALAPDGDTSFMTAAQRALVLAVDDSGMPAGRVAVDAALDRLVGLTPAGDRESVVQSLASRAPGGGATAQLSPLARLTVWTQLGDRLTAGPDVADPPDRDGRGRLAAVLRSLVAEGAPPEQ